MADHKIGSKRREKEGKVKTSKLRDKPSRKEDSASLMFPSSSFDSTWEASIERPLALTSRDCNCDCHLVELDSCSSSSSSLSLDSILFSRNVAFAGFDWKRGAEVPKCTTTSRSGGRGERERAGARADKNGISKNIRMMSS